MPKAGELLIAWCERVSDLGFPVPEDAGELLGKLDTEVEKRNQNNFNMYIYNDWTGHGISECFENYVSHNPRAQLG